MLEIKSVPNKAICATYNKSESSPNVNTVMDDSRCGIIILASQSALFYKYYLDIRYRLYYYLEGGLTIHFIINIRHMDGCRPEDTDEVFALTDDHMLIKAASGIADNPTTICSRFSINKSPALWDEEYS